MHLTIQQTRTYSQSGWLLLNNVFTPVEVALMKHELAAVLRQESPSRILEKDAVTVRSVYGSHRVNEVFECLAAHPRLVEPARQLVEDGDVYVHQFKINAKSALGDGSWAWHQDYIFWLKEDGMPSASVVTAAVFLDAVTEFNGPMFLIPGSHQGGVIETEARQASPGAARVGGEPSWIANVVADLKYSLHADTIRQLVARHGIASPKAPAGSVLFFHGNIAHCSGPNLSPFDRAVALVTYNSVQNALRPVAQPRPEFLASRDFSPIVACSDDALLRLRPVDAATA